MAHIMKWLKLAVERNASDIFIGAERRVFFKLDGEIEEQSDSPVTMSEADEMVKSMYEIASRTPDKLTETGDDNFPLSVPGLARFRVSAYCQRSSVAAVIRVVKFEIPSYKHINIPGGIMELAAEKNGLCLVTGLAGCGKTTTLACIIDEINKTRNCHVITIEDPVEYLHKDIKSIISQREVFTDTASYLTALQAAMKQAPDVILLGEISDAETIRTAMTAAETGHLIISTLHTVGAVNTINRIIDVFPAEQLQQIRTQLSMTLRTVVSQQMLRTKLGGLVPVFEIMHANNAVRNMIRESNIHQIDGVIQVSAREGMVSMDSSILKLFRQGTITSDVAVSAASNAYRSHYDIKSKHHTRLEVDEL